MELVCERNEERPNREEERNIVILGNCLPGAKRCQANERRHGERDNHAVITVALDVVMARDGQRVNVMLSEGPNEGLPMKKDAHKSPSSLLLHTHHSTIYFCVREFCVVWFVPSLSPLCRRASQSNSVFVIRSSEER